MDPIKINGGPPQVSRTGSAGAEEQKTEKPNAPGKSGAAATFNKNETSLHQAFEDVVDRVEAATHDRIAKLRQQIADGTYEPDLKVVAERLLTDLTEGRD